MKIHINSTQNYSSSKKQSRNLLQHMNVLFVILKRVSGRIVIWSAKQKLSSITKGIFTGFVNKSHYYSTARSWSCEKYSFSESLFYQLKQYYIPQGLNQKFQKFTFASFHTAYSYTLRRIHG